MGQVKGVMSATNYSSHFRTIKFSLVALQWLHNEHDGVSNYEHLDCLLTCLFRHISKKTSKLRATGLCDGNSPVTGTIPAQRPATRTMLPLDDVIMRPGAQTVWWLLMRTVYMLQVTAIVWLLRRAKLWVEFHRHVLKQCRLR